MLLTYLIVVVVVIGILYGSFRALGGGGEPVAAADYRTVLARLGEMATTRAAELREALEASEEAPGGGTEAAGTARKALGGYLQQLSRLEFDAPEDERAELDAARSHLERGLEDLGWACRMVEAGVYRDNAGIRSAVEVLRAHADECLESVRVIVGSV